MKSSIISAVVALAAFAKTPAEVPKEHRYPDAAQGGHLLVLQCGSDWCESGEDVRKVFESATFRDALGSGWEFAVYDDMDAPTPDVKAANEPLSKLRVESKRFPAITCLTPEPRRFFAQLENIPFDVTAKALAAQVAAATSAKDEAVRLFGMAKASGDAAKAADAYGEAFALLSAQVGEFNGKSLREGGLAFADEWKALVKLDVGNWGKWRGSKFAGTRPALLEEVLELARDGRWLYIDVKSKSAEIVPYVKAIFEKQKRANPKNTLFLCGSVECGKAFKKLMPEYKVLSCLNCCKDWKKGAPPEPVENIIATTREMGADGVDLRFIRSVTTPEYMKAIKDAGLELHVWTVDDLADAVEAFKRGAQTVTTNCAKKLLDEYNASLANAGLSLEDGFKAPPASAKPHTWYHMMNGNVTKEGITCDFEALAKAGIGGVQMFDAGCAIPPGPLKFNSDDWFDMFAHAHKEAKRLGLEICIPNCSGWSSSGGPWNPPANGMKVIRFTETKVAGPRSRWSATLPREKKDNGFYDDIAVLAYPTPKGSAQLSNLPEKMFAKRGGVKRDTKPVADDALVAKDAVIDLTSKMKKDGALEWDVPAGDWTILRIGYICNGRCNHPASEKGRGLEVDKLSASAMDYHFAQYVTRLCKTLGIEPGKIGETGFNNILVDSYEVDVQNWTQGFDKTFEKRMGYSLTRYLPVFAGRIVGSVEESERFLEDFRRVVADLFAENYAGRLTELCHRHGLLCSIEPYGNCPADNLQYGQDIDIPMAEYWSTAARGAHHSGNIGNSRLAATLAHVWGRRYAATESFTASPGPGGRWRTTPYSIKAQGDKVFAAGINRIIYHRFTHQPWPGNKYVPGMTMGRWGMHLDRTQTWWPLAGDWFRYQARCQWMLQEGKFAADVLFWCGEAVPLGGTDTKLPDGYDYDYCATKAFLELKVENGRVVAPGGVSYALLVLPKTDTMSEVCVKKVGELLDAGAKISSVSRPVRTPGLRGWNGRARSPSAPYQALVDSVWAKGVIGKSAADAVASLGIAPDFMTETPDASWIHRRSADADWYFVALDNAAPTKFEAFFRQTGRIPEVWNAETGCIRDASAWREENGRTIVSLDYPISGSAFVVFRRTSSTTPHVTGVKATVSARPDPALPEKTHTLVIKKAEYGVFDAAKTPTGKPIAIDVMEKLASLVKNGTIDVAVENELAGCDPLFRTVKKMVVTYVYDGKEYTMTFKEHERFKLPGNKLAPPPPPDWELKCGKFLAWQPLSAEISLSDGTKKSVDALPPAGVVVPGPWSVAFPAGWDAPASATFDSLIPWNEHTDNGIKYFSGTATYKKRIDCEKARALIASSDCVMLDLGVVKDFAEVTVNGKKFPVLWKPPFRLDITDAVKTTSVQQQGCIDIEIKVTNLWPNRIIGDDTLYADDCVWMGKTRRGVKEFGVREIPQWVKEGKPSPTGRHTFTTWRHWSKEDDLLPSGLIGPVMLRGGVIAK